uniref:Uncharacterized protein n=1 Tax=Sphaerodactylus townsendi TaxID=933632 RepID=A0ACB8FCB6_9SAUR
MFVKESMTSLETQQGEVPARAEAGRPISADLTGTSDSASDPAEGPRMLSGEATALGGDPTPTGLSDSTNLFLTAPLNGLQGVTVRRHRGPDYYRDSQTLGCGSASWAMAPLAGNVSVAGCPSEVADSSEAEAWWMLQASEEAWDSQREEYCRVLHQIEQSMGHLRAALVQAQQAAPASGTGSAPVQPATVPVPAQGAAAIVAAPAQPAQPVPVQLPAPAAVQVPAIAPVQGQPSLPPAVQPAPVQLPAPAALQAPAAPVHGQQPYCCRHRQHLLRPFP